MAEDARSLIAGLELAAGEDSRLSMVVSMFSRVEIAEEEIACAKAEWPGRDAEFDAAFVILNSPIVSNVPVMTRLPVKGQELYRMHARQLLKNIAEGHDVDRPTMVELGIVMTTGSTYTHPPPTELGYMLMADREWAEWLPGIDVVDVPESTLDMAHWWPIVERWCCSIYARVYGPNRTRGKEYKRSLKLYEKRQRQPELF